MFEALETNHGDKLPNQHFRRIFSKGIMQWNRETGQSNLWKSSQQMIYIDLL